MSLEKADVLATTEMESASSEMKGAARNYMDVRKWLLM